MNINDPAYRLVDTLIAYYYGVDASSVCPRAQINTGIIGDNNEIYSLDNIGAAFDILNIVDGPNAPTTGYTTSAEFPDGYVHLDSSVLNEFIDEMSAYDNDGLVCPDQNFQTESDLPTYNTAVDINPPYDVGLASKNQDLTRTYIGVLPYNSNYTCDTASQATDYKYLIDINCDNLAVANLPSSNPPPPSCSITASPAGSSEPLGTPVTFSLVWHVPKPQATEVSATITSNTAPTTNVAPANIISPAATTTVGYNQTESLQNQPVKTSTTQIIYSGYMNVVIPADTTNTNQKITCKPSNESGSNPGGGTGNTTCTGLATVSNTAEVTYNTAYTTWYNYDQKSVGSGSKGGFQYYKSITDGAYIDYQTALNGSLIPLVNAYNAALAAYKQDVVDYNNLSNNPPTRPKAPTYTAPVRAKGETNAQYNAAVQAAQKAYQAALNTYDNVALPAYNRALSTYNNELLNYTSKILPTAKSNYQAAYNKMVAEYNSAGLQTPYNTFKNNSEVTYTDTALLFALVADGTTQPTTPGGPFVNNNSYFATDTGYYNTMETDLELWQAALQQQDAACDTKPYFTVSGGDVIAGAGKTISGCAANTAANIYGSNIGSSPWTGASDNLATLAPSLISGFSSGSATSRNQLAFSNTTNSPYGGDFGTANSVCTPDYYDTYKSIPAFTVDPANGAFSLASVSNSGPCQLIDTTYYCKVNGPAQISGNPPSGSKVVVYVAGNAIISSNISFYTNDNYYDSVTGTYSTVLDAVDDIPLLYVISNANIYIDNNVSSIDGIYSAAGTIYTCANGSGSFSSDQTLIAGCGQSNPLSVNGSLVANEIKFGRVGGDLPNTSDWTAGSAETITYGPNVWLSQVNSSLPTTPNYTDLTELSPVI
jgi:hypothetical protein